MNIKHAVTCVYGGGVCSTAETHHALHLLISCLTYTSSTAEGSGASVTKSSVRQRREGHIIRCYRIHTDAPGCGVIAYTIGSMYLSLQRHWLSRCWPAAGSAGIQSPPLWTTVAAAAQRFLPEEEGREHVCKATVCQLPAVWKEVCF